MSTTTTQHIENHDKVCGGKPCVKGTRISVWDIHVWHDLRGQSPEEIVVLYPQLTVADVYAALAYYLDHQKVIDQQADEDWAAADLLEAKQGPTRFTQLRDELFQDKNGGKNGNGDSVSPG